MTTTNFDEMSYEHLKEIAKKWFQMLCLKRFIIVKLVKLTLGLREIKSTQDIAEMMKVDYESRNEIDMYVEHFGYDIMELVKLEVNEEHNHNSIEESDDGYYGSDDYEEIENVDFQTEGDESVVIKSISTHDPFLTKLCSARIMFRGTDKHQQIEAPLADPDDHQIHAVNKVQSGVLYPAFYPDIHWDKMKPTLGMRYETPYQLKMALANYGVAHEGRWSGKKGNKDRVMKNKVRSGVQIGVKKKVLKKKVVKKKPVRELIKSLSRVGRTMTCTNCWQKGHNKVTCMADPSPKPPVEKKTPGRNKQSAIDYYASRGSGKGRGKSENEASGSGMGGIDEASGRGRGGTRGRGRRGRGMKSSVWGEVVVKEYQLHLDEEAYRECMEEQVREQAKNDAEQERLDKEIREEREWEEKNDYFNPANFREDSLEKAPFNDTYAEVFIPSIHSQPTQQSGVWVKDTTDVTTKNLDEFSGMETSETTNVAEGIGSAMEEELSAPAVDKGK
ncbi:hypothetical protein Tco_0815392 [Tanacetum coccineum]